MPYRPRHQSRRGCSCLGRILTFLVLLALLCYPFAEPYMLETESVSLSSADLPQDIGQLRIVYLSDIHAGFFFSQSRVNDLVQTVNRLNADLVLLGGDFQNDAQVMVGPILRTCAAQFYVNKLFVGADGYTEKLGFTGVDHLRVQAVRDMAEHAEQVVVLTESKFTQRGVVPMGIMDRIQTVVTDNSISPEAEDSLSHRGVRVLKAQL